MATITIKYDDKNHSAKQIIDGLVAVGVFSIKEKMKNAPMILSS